jgi:hypothetical protein
VLAPREISLLQTWAAQNRLRDANYDPAEAATTTTAAMAHIGHARKGDRHRTMRHVTVYHEAEIFAGWPANNGLWCWDSREILVGLTCGPFEEKSGHNIGEPYRSILARSGDQGETWTTVEPANFVGSHAEVRCPTDKIDFTHPGFAMRIVGTGYHGSTSADGAFYVSSNRGDTWQGPCSFGSLTDHPELRGLDITSRTDYVVQGPQECLLMMSARSAGASLDKDRIFCARTSDGGRRFHFVSWVVPPTDPDRAVMPSTVQSGSGQLVTAIRRRQGGGQRCWIDAYGSADNGRSWKLLCKVADTGPWNGNPPALVRLDDRRLCCVYGERATCRILARYSGDSGRTWDRDVVLRADFHRDRHGDPDLGYPRVMQRADGKLAAIYYWATAAMPHQHIAATIWDPAEGADTRLDAAL